MIYAMRFPITDGLVVAGLKAGLTAWSPVTVRGKLPAGNAADPFTRRMVTVRNDSGPQESVLSRRRYGINVWADSSTDAENIAHDAMAVLRQLPTGQPITTTDQFSGPYEIPEDVPLVVGSKNLTHYYFAFRLSVRATNF